ncbi:DNA damage-regulated autophagy modulator protein 1-like isoform X2 [Uloborus diversus]|uniref:DNA damage-regulated autophagy modulator protein 1-like isoform X2 n=1 Tax=Uloborus diversus TaxID=327109 RepID=UPI00240984BC|nr:DNA damage-regulated autophagy modulator protein 1-like isoform X2 [Uloborus diversus]
MLLLYYEKMSLRTCLSSGISTIFIRYIIVDELNRGIDRLMDILNRISVCIGFIALLGMVVVAAYPMTSIATAHGIGANILFLGGVIYASLQTALSFRMSPYYNGKFICFIRLTITIISGISLIVLISLMPFAMKEWGGSSHSHWTGAKTPKDKGFYLLLASSIAEWSMAISFLAYYFTFIREFAKVCIHLRVQMLVTHFDEEPHAASVGVVNERTPIVMQRNDDG